MALSYKTLALLKQIYASRRRGEEKFVEEDSDEALEYMLQGIADRLSDRHHNAAPLYRVIESAIASLSLDRQERRKVPTS